ncbi:molybdenum cofactor biosynthesis F family protein [Pseudomonas sp. S 311-6]|nr:molybdenum cofactor biosynthesis F family protein [Pseudomonas sp. S 311-6]
MNHSRDTADWITVGALADGFAPDAFILPRQAELAGKQFELNFANGWQAALRFETEALDWRPHSDVAACRVPYRATSIRDGIYLVDFLQQGKDYVCSISVLLDLNTHAVTAVIGRLPTPASTCESLYQRALRGEALTGVDVDILNGCLDRPWEAGACAHHPTNALIGLRNRYRYSPTEVYEHIYLNEKFYTWHCLAGVEQGLCDTDRCHYYHIADALYLFIWREKIVPTLGVLVIDMAQHRSDGKIYGYADSDFRSVSNFPVASYCDVLNRTDYNET